MHDTKKPKMSKSLLSMRIGVCNLIPNLNKIGCIDVIRAIGESMEFCDLNQFITKIFMDYSNNWSIDDITQFANEMNQISCNSSNNRCEQPSRKSSIKHDEKPNEDTKFPLLRLPIDLITKASLYLNEKDILKFERCCRLFYQMINSTSYLNVSNNFKTFTIKDETLDQMSQTRCSFFKYSKAKHLRLQCDSEDWLCIDGGDSNQYTIKMRSQWEKAMITVKNEGWFDSMWKSIARLDMGQDGMGLVDKLPIELLFDPHESHLNEIQFFHHWNEHLMITQYISQFEKEYLNIQHKLEQQGKQMRKLTCVN